MHLTTALGSFGPFQPWVEVRAEALAWHDEGRKGWVGRNIKLGESCMTVDRVENLGDGIWRIHLIEPAEEG